MELRNLPLVFVDDLDDPRVVEADYQHFARVLRISAGDPIAIGDGSGSWRPARFGEAPTVTGPVEHEPLLSPPITVGFTPVKGDRDEWFVQKLTELGVDVIVPVLTERAVVRRDHDRQAKLRDRMVQTAREACLQSRRLRVPKIEDTLPLVDFLSANPGASLADPGGRPPTAATTTTLVVGPEGGFSASERELAPLVALPGNVLRAATAAVVAGAIAVGLRSDLLAAQAR